MTMQEGRPQQAAANGAAKGPGTLADVCRALRRKVLGFLAARADGDEVLRRTQARARESMGVVDEALRRYRRDELSLSYNGGKDCLVLLILILACLPAASARPAAGPESADSESTGDAESAAAGSAAAESTDTADAESPDTADAAAPPPPPLQAIYIAPPDPFPEVEDFVAASAARYHLDLARYALPMRLALEAYQADRPAVQAVFMGTRRTDPHSEFLTPFSPTDGDWPRLMRVNPVLDWHYQDIWAFIRHLDIPFCSLYNRGFTSLGGTRNTRPNPALALAGDSKAFRPAYELVRDDEERLGRDR